MYVNGIERAMNQVYEKRHVGLLVILVFLASSVLYFNALLNGFVFDDMDNVVNNPWIKDSGYIAEIFSSHLAGFDKGFATNYYRPLVHLIYMFTYRVFGAAPLGFHLMNVLFHVGVCVLVFLLAAAILGQSGASNPAHAFLPPVIAALMFAAHPIHTEGVAWVAGVMDVSFTFFYLLSFYFYLKSSDEGRTLGRSHLLSVVSFFFATLCKEPALTLPLILFAYDFSFRQEELKLNECLKRYLPYGFVMGIYLALRMNALGGFAPVKAEMNLTPYQYFLNILVLFSRYLEKLLVPINLNVYHVFDPIISLFTMKGMISLLVAGTFLSLVLLLRKIDRILFFALLMIVIPLLPSLYIPALSQGVENAFSERYLYLPSFGFVLVLGGLGARVLRNGARAGIVLAVIASLLMVWYSVETVRRNRVWRDNNSLWSDAVRKSPDNANIRGNLGYALYVEGELDEAIEQYRIALNLKPDLPNVRLNLGVAFHRKGWFDQAVEQYRMVLNLRPSADAHSNLGLALLDLGWIEDGIDHCRRAVTLNPALADAHHNLGIGYARKGVLDQAIHEFQIAIRLNPDSRLYRDNLMKAYGDRK